MSRYHKAVTDFVPIDYELHLGRIDVYFDWQHKALVKLFDDWGLRPLLSDDCEALVDQLKRRLVSFALDCNSLPMRTPNQLVSTVRAILRNPSDFVEKSERYDPEVVALMLGALGGVSHEASVRVHEYELGTGSRPGREDVLEAARSVLRKLQSESSAMSNVGGQNLVLQRQLIKDLAQIFKNYGGRVTRITRFVDEDPRPRYVEGGPFHDFLAIVLPPALLFARRAGLKMKSHRSLVASILGATLG